jgi:hypothetical protein
LRRKKIEQKALIKSATHSQVYLSSDTTKGEYQFKAKTIAKIMVYLYISKYIHIRKPNDAFMIYTYRKEKMNFPSYTYMILPHQRFPLPLFSLSPFSTTHTPIRRWGLYSKRKKRKKRKELDL